MPSFSKVGGSEPAGSESARRQALLDKWQQQPRFLSISDKAKDELLSYALAAFEEEPLAAIGNEAGHIAALFDMFPSVPLPELVRAWWEPPALSREQMKTFLSARLGPEVNGAVLDRILDIREGCTLYKLHFDAWKIRQAIGKDTSLRHIEAVLEAWAKDDAGPAASLGSISGSAPAGRLGGSLAGAVASIPWQLLHGIHKIHSYFAGPSQWIEGSPQDRRRLLDRLMQESALAVLLSYLSEQELKEALDFMLRPLEGYAVAEIDRMGAGIAALSGMKPSFERMRAAAYGWWNPGAVSSAQREQMLAELLGPKVHTHLRNKILEKLAALPLSTLHDEAGKINAAIGADKSPPHVKAVVEAWAAPRDIGPTVLNLQPATAWAHFLNFAAQSGQLNLLARGMSAYLCQAEYREAGHRPGPWVVAQASESDAWKAEYEARIKVQAEVAVQVELLGLMTQTLNSTNTGQPDGAALFKSKLASRLSEHRAVLAGLTLDAWERDVLDKKIVSLEPYLQRHDLFNTGMPPLLTQGKDGAAAPEALQAQGRAVMDRRIAEANHRIGQLFADHRTLFDTAAQLGETAEQLRLGEAPPPANPSNAPMPSPAAPERSVWSRLDAWINLLPFPVKGAAPEGSIAAMPDEEDLRNLMEMTERHPEDGEPQETDSAFSALMTPVLEVARRPDPNGDGETFYTEIQTMRQKESTQQSAAEPQVLNRAKRDIQQEKPLSANERENANAMVGAVLHRSNRSSQGLRVMTAGINPLPNERTAHYFMTPRELRNQTTWESGVAFKSFIEARMLGKGLVFGVPPDTPDRQDRSRWVEVRLESSGFLVDLHSPDHVSPFMLGERSNDTYTTLRKAQLEVLKIIELHRPLAYWLFDGEQRLDSGYVSTRVATTTSVTTTMQARPFIPDQLAYRSFWKSDEAVQVLGAIPGYFLLTLSIDLDNRLVLQHKPKEQLAWTFGLEKNGVASGPDKYESFSALLPLLRSGINDNMRSIRVVHFNFKDEKGKEHAGKVVSGHYTGTTTTMTTTTTTPRAPVTFEPKRNDTTPEERTPDDADTRRWREDVARTYGLSQSEAEVIRKEDRVTTIHQCTPAADPECETYDKEVSLEVWLDTPRLSDDADSEVSFLWPAHYPDALQTKLSANNASSLTPATGTTTPVPLKRKTHTPGSKHEVPSQAYHLLLAFTGANVGDSFDFGTADGANKFVIGHLDGGAGWILVSSSRGTKDYSNDDLAQLLSAAQEEMQEIAKSGKALEYGLMLAPQSLGNGAAQRMKQDLLIATMNVIEAWQSRDVLEAFLDGDGGDSLLFRTSDASWSIKVSRRMGDAGWDVTSIRQDGDGIPQETTAFYPPDEVAGLKTDVHAEMLGIIEREITQTGQSPYQELKQGDAFLGSGSVDAIGGQNPKPAPTPARTEPAFFDVFRNVTGARDVGLIHSRGPLPVGMQLGVDIEHSASAWRRGYSETRVVTLPPDATRGQYHWPLALCNAVNVWPDLAAGELKSGALRPSYSGYLNRFYARPGSDFQTVSVREVKIATNYDYFDNLDDWKSGRASSEFWDMPQKRMVDLATEDRSFALTFSDSLEQSGVDVKWQADGKQTATHYTRAQWSEFSAETEKYISRILASKQELTCSILGPDETEGLAFYKVVRGTSTVLDPQSKSESMTVSDILTHFKIPPADVIEKGKKLTWELLMRVFERHGEKPQLDTDNPYGKLAKDRDAIGLISAITKVAVSDLTADDVLIYYYKLAQTIWHWKAPEVAAPGGAADGQSRAVFKQQLAAAILKALLVADEDAFLESAYQHKFFVPLKLTERKKWTIALYLRDVADFTADIVDTYHNQPERQRGLTILAQDKYLDQFAQSGAAVDAVLAQQPSLANCGSSCQSRLDQFWQTPDPKANGLAPEKQLEQELRKQLELEAGLRHTDGTLTAVGKALLNEVCAKPSALERASIPAGLRPAVYGVSLPVAGPPVALAGAFVITTKDRSDETAGVVTVDSKADTGPVVLYTLAHGIEEFPSLEKLEKALYPRFSADKTLHQYVARPDLERIIVDDGPEAKPAVALTFTEIIGNTFSNLVQSLLNQQARNLAHVLQENATELEAGDALDAAVDLRPLSDTDGRLNQRNAQLIESWQPDWYKKASAADRDGLDGLRNAAFERNRELASVLKENNFLSLNDFAREKIKEYFKSKYPDLDPDKCKVTIASVRGANPLNPLNFFAHVVPALGPTTVFTHPTLIEFALQNSKPWSFDYLDIEIERITTFVVLSDSSGRRIGELKDGEATSFAGAVDVGGQYEVFTKEKYFSEHAIAKAWKAAHIATMKSDAREARLSNALSATGSEWVAAIVDHPNPETRPKIWGRQIDTHYIMMGRDPNVRTGVSVDGVVVISAKNAELSVLFTPNAPDGMAFRECLDWQSEVGRLYKLPAWQEYFNARISESIDDPSVRPGAEVEVQISPPISGDLHDELYKANVRLQLAVANHQSVSNQDRAWQSELNGFLFGVDVIETFLPMFGSAISKGARMLASNIIGAPRVAQRALSVFRGRGFNFKPTRLAAVGSGRAWQSMPQFPAAGQGIEFAGRYYRAVSELDPAWHEVYPGISVGDVGVEQNVIVREIKSGELYAVDMRTGLPFGPRLFRPGELGDGPRFFPREIPLAKVDGGYLFPDPGPEMSKTWTIKGDEALLEVGEVVHRKVARDDGVLVLRRIDRNAGNEEDLIGFGCRIKRDQTLKQCAPNAYTNKDYNDVTVQDERAGVKDAVPWFTDRKIIASETGKEFVHNGFVWKAGGAKPVKVNRRAPRLNAQAYKPDVKAEMIGGNDIFKQVRIKGGIFNGIDDTREVSAVVVKRKGDGAMVMVTRADDGAYYKAVLPSTYRSGTDLPMNRIDFDEDVVAGLKKSDPNSANHENNFLVHIYGGSNDANWWISQLPPAMVDKNLELVRQQIAAGEYMDVEGFAAANPFELSTAPEQQAVFFKHIRAPVVMKIRANTGLATLTKETPAAVRADIAKELNVLTGHTDFDADNVLNSGQIKNRVTWGGKRKNLAYAKMTFKDQNKPVVLYSLSGYRDKQAALPLATQETIPSGWTRGGEGVMISPEGTRYINVQPEAPAIETIRQWDPYAGEQIFVPDASSARILDDPGGNLRLTDSERNIMQKITKDYKLEELESIGGYSTTAVCNSCTYGFGKLKNSAPPGLRIEMYDGA